MPMCFRPYFQILALLITPPSLAVATDGPITSGGGDEVALEFTQAFENAFQEIHANHRDLAAMLNGQDLRVAMSRASLFVVDQPLTVEYQGIRQESVATNTPASGWIVINRYRWKQIRQQRIREAVALHEVASLLGLEGTGRYPISSAYLGKFQFEPDPALILSGKDPATESAFTIQRLSCETNLVNEHRRTGKKSSTTYHSLDTSGSWQIRGKDYAVTYFHSTSADGNSVPWLSRKKSVATQRDGGWLTEVDSSMLFINADSAKVQESTEQAAYFGERREGKNIVYSWVNGAKAQVMSRSTAIRMPDGSQRNITLLEKDAFPEGEYADAGSSFTCTIKDLSLAAWLVLADDAKVAAEITRLDHLAFLANDAERKSRTCSAETCGALRTESEAREQDFVAAWNKLYEERKVDISKKYEAVREKWQKRERARQRQIQRQRPGTPAPRRGITPAEESASRAIERIKRENHRAEVEKELEEIRRELERIRRSRR